METPRFYKPTCRRPPFYTTGLGGAFLNTLGAFYKSYLGGTVPTNHNITVELP